MPREEPEWRRKVGETRVKNGHLEAADRLMFCRLLQSAGISSSKTVHCFGSTLPKSGADQGLEANSNGCNLQSGIRKLVGGTS